MYPTAPLITKDDIKKGYKKLSKNIDFVFSLMQVLPQYIDHLS